MREIINIIALKYPDIPHYEWQGELIIQEEEYVLVLCKPGRKLTHYTKGATFSINNTSLEYFSLKEWFTVAMEIEQGKIVSYYCNVAQPSTLVDDTLCFVDLDLDLVKQQKKDWTVVDEDEFEVNSLKYNYSAELKEKAMQSLDDLKRKVRNKEFPFVEDFLERCLF